MRQFSFGGLTLVGYYGYNNLGDDLLLLSSLSLIDEIGFEGPIYLPASSHIEQITHRFPSNSISDWLVALVLVRSQTQLGTQCHIFGGGNLLQDQTSWRSFFTIMRLPGIPLTGGNPCFFSLKVLDR